MNYLCVAVAVFGGAWGEAAAGSAGGVAWRVSQASFYMLTLVYTLSQVRTG